VPSEKSAVEIKPGELASTEVSVWKSHALIMRVSEVHSGQGGTSQADISELMMLTALRATPQNCRCCLDISA